MDEEASKRGKRTITRDKPTAIERAHALRTDGLSLRKIVEQLQKERILPARCDVGHAASILDLLRQPVPSILRLDEPSRPSAGYAGARALRFPRPRLARWDALAIHPQSDRANAEALTVQVADPTHGDLFLRMRDQLFASRRVGLL